MLMNHSFIIGSSIAALTIIAMLPKSAEIFSGRSLINQPLLEEMAPQFIDIKTQPVQQKLTRRGLPKRRDGGGTRYV